jgi:hypothetical protein
MLDRHLNIGYDVDIHSFGELILYARISGIRPTAGTAEFPMTP